MSKAEAKPGAEVDADGLVVQKYRSVVLVVVPPAEYAEETLRYARSSLYNVHVGTWSVSTEDRELIKGRHQDEFVADAKLDGVQVDGYSGVIFVGGEGARQYFENAEALRIARDAAKQKKMIGAWGHATEILARAGVLRGRKVTGDPSTRAAVERAGGKYTSRQIEIDDKLVTARDDAVGMRLGKALAAIVGI
jgi:protease I